MKLLIVEDDMLIVQRILKDLGQVYQDRLTVLGPVQSFGEGVRLLQTDQPDMALMGIQLGDDTTGGIRLAEIMNHKGAVPIVYLTGLPDKLGFDKAKHTLPCVFLKKPYDVESFQRAVDLAIAHSHHRNIMTNYHPSFLKPLDEHSIWIKVTHGKFEPILLNEILFVESDNHYLTIYTSSHPEKVKFKSTLTNFFQNNLSVFPQFFELDRSHVLNLKKIQKIEANHIYFTKDLKISIPKSSRKEFFQRLNLPFQI